MTREISTAGAPKPAGPYSQGMRAGDLVFVAGQGGFVPETGELVEGIEAQTLQALANVEAILHAAGASVADVVKTTVFLADLSEFAQMNDAYRSQLPESQPVRSTVQAVLAPGMRIEIDAIACTAG